MSPRLDCPNGLRAPFSLLVGLLALATLSTIATAQTRTNNTKTVQTSSGLLVGVESKPEHASYQTVIKFLGVPYARPPTGQLRFKRPVELPGEQSAQLVDATKFGPTCPQHRHLVRFISPLLNLDQEHTISEDCLQLNLFVPSPSLDKLNGTSGMEEQQKLLPVIVWIPGEGFDFADARQFDGSQLALRTRSIVVTVQYRVGVFGLLDAPELGIDGNQAVHDQLMALRWVSQNIGAFGGDRDRVTAMGRFTGAMSISTMLTAPNQELVTRRTSDGEQVALFQRAILTSGIAVDDWIIVDNQRAKMQQVLEEARSKYLCDAASERPLDCLQSLPMTELLEISGYKWRLVRDNQLVSDKGGPIEILRKGPQSNNFRLPQGVEAIMLGETGAEGTLCLFRHLLMSGQNERARIIEEDQLTSEHLNELIRDDLATYFSYNSSNQALEMALDALVDTSTMLKSSAPGQLRQRYLDACSSYMVRSHNQRFKRHLQQAVHGHLQLDHYQLRYKPSFSLAPDYIETAAHGDDVPLIFGLVYNQPEAKADDLAMTQKMLAYIGDFVHGKRQRRAAKSQAESEPGQMKLLDVSRADGDESERTSLEKRPLADGPFQRARLVLVEPVLELASGERQAETRPKQQVASQDNSPATRSQKLLELHRQQQALYGPGANNELSTATETSLATALLLAASIVILALMSVCVVLSVLVVRYNALVQRHDGVGGREASAMGARHKRSLQFNSSSTCNICDDSQGSSIDAVLSQQASAKKSEHAFCSVFAKLKHNHHQSAAPNATACEPKTLLASTNGVPVATVAEHHRPAGTGGHLGPVSGQ